VAAIVIDGKAIAAKFKEEIRDRVSRIKQLRIIPCLAVVLVGEDPASASYVRGKQKALADLGMDGLDIRLPEMLSQEELLKIIATLNADPKVHGILVQLPLPPQINEETILAAIEPVKDVDCFHPVSLGKLIRGQGGYLPCTPQAVVVLLQELKIPISGSHAVVIGRSNIVGKPIATLLARKELNATVTVCHTGTKDLPFFTRHADILISAVGQPGLIKGDMIKKGAAVIDVGIRMVGGEGGTRRRMVGDVVFEEALETAGWITPVPGGVGPMTIAMLMKNVAEAAEIINNLQ